MPQEVRLPSLGQTSDELRILKWFRGEGDTVQMGERLLEVETDKAALEVEAAIAGTVLKIVAREGEIVQAGSLVAYLGEPGEPVPAPAEPVSGFVEAEHDVNIRPPHPPEAEETAAGGIPATRKVLASPAVRQLARAYGIELDELRGSGPGGRIEKEDVLRFVYDQDRET